MDEDFADEDDDDDDDDTTASLETKPSLTGNKDAVLLTVATVLLPRTWALKSKSSPSSSSTT